MRIIEPFAALKKKGSNWMGCCPFHSEKTPSFSVSPSKGFYKCFGCGKGGSVYNFLMEIEGLSFPEAVKAVAERTGIPLPEPVDDVNYQKNKKKKEAKKKIADQVIDLNRIALEFWEAELQKKYAKAKAAREYLETRGISEETQKAFHIGFSPDSWDSLLNLLKDKGAKDEIVEQSGLVSVKEEKDRVFDRFRGRIMFPILDLNGNPVAFGARAMGSDEPKYLNSPETPAYTKGRHLYGLFQGKNEIRLKKFVILVEGYLDLIALYQHGITNVVASLGTAFTSEQSKLLSRFAKKVVINYDGDTAGIEAARKAIEVLLPNNFDIKVFTLPDRADPDDYVRQYGSDEYNTQRGKARSYLQFVLDHALRQRNILNPRHQADALSEVLPVISAIRNPIEKRSSFDQSVSSLMIAKPQQTELWRSVKAGSLPIENILNKQIKRATQAKITVAEQHLLELLVYDSELQEKILPQLEESDYETLATALVFRALFEINDKNLVISRENLLELAGDDETATDFVPLLLMTEPRREPDEAIDSVLHEAENCVFTLRLMAISSRIAEISQEALHAEQSGQEILHNRLTFEQLELEKIKRELLNRIRQT
ncbi:MAG: DNA primase [Acidobacteriota bacterium]|nr:DNA primase [Acidobacteriota bacterium]